MRNDFVGAVQRFVCDFGRGHDRQALHIDIFLVKLAREVSVDFIYQWKKRCGWSGDGGSWMAGCGGVGELSAAGDQQ
jgi:hypothetical protein